MGLSHVFVRELERKLVDIDKGEDGHAGTYARHEAGAQQKEGRGSARGSHRGPTLRTPLLRLCLCLIALSQGAIN